MLDYLTMKNAGDYINEFRVGQLDVVGERIKLGCTRSTLIRSRHLLPYSNTNNYFENEQAFMAGNARVC